MKLPNGYGSVKKLSGRRRRPWIVQKTIGWENVNGKAKQKKITIGYFPTKKEGMEALAQYNLKPWNMDKNAATLEYCYQKWSERHYQTLKEGSIANYKVGWGYLEPLANIPIADIKTEALQEIMDGIIAQGRSISVQKRVKGVAMSCFDYAIQNDLADRNYANYVSTKEMDAKIERIPYTLTEIEKLWEINDCNAKILLILLYSGMRIGELLEMKQDSVDISGKKMFIAAAKTKAGIRTVPIHEQIYPLVKEFYEIGGEYLIINPTTHGKYNYSTFNKKGSGGFYKINRAIGSSHHMHDTRHTFISRAKEIGMDDTYTKIIVGHQLDGVTRKIYTHVAFESLYQEMQKLDYQKTPLFK